MLLMEGAQALVSWGTAGALVPELETGNLVLPEVVVDPTVKHLSVDQIWCRRIGSSLGASLVWQHGKIAHAKDVVAAPTQKARLRDQTDAIAVDMESAAVGEAAMRAGVPFVVIRSIVDPCSLTIPRSASLSVDAYGRTQSLKLITALLRAPSEVIGLIRCGLAFRTALATLVTVAKRVGPELCYRPGSFTNERAHE
jgi:adenosylhomocysteine nucleosidase